MHDLADVHVVDAQAGALVPLALLLGHEGGVELLAIKLLALDGQVGFGVDGIAQVGELDGEAGAGDLVLVPARGTAQV